MVADIPAVWNVAFLGLTDDTLARSADREKDCRA